MTLQGEVARLVHGNGLLSVLSVLVAVCDQDSKAVPNNRGATIIAYRIEEIV